MREVERRIAVQGGDVFTRSVGGGPGLPLLVLHGGPGFPHDALAPLDSLSDERTVVFYDQLGCGRSERPSDPGLWRLDRFVREVQSVREGLGVERCFVLGHSWGGALALEHALRRPHTLAGLVLASPLISTPVWMADQARHRSALPTAVRDVLDCCERDGRTDSADYAAATRAFYARHLCRLEPAPAALDRSLAGANFEIYQTLWGHTEFTASGLLRDYDASGRLSDLALPTLFTCGRHDEATPESTARFAAAVEGAELHVFEDSAHMAQLEEPERFVAVVRDFLERAERR